MNKIRDYFTPEEKKSLAASISRETGQTEEEVEEELCGYTTIVIENYISDSPGYWGQLYLVVASGGPEFYQLYDKNFDPVEQYE